MELRHSEHREQHVQRRGCPEGGRVGVWDRGPEHKGSRPAGDVDFILRPGSTGTENSRCARLSTAQMYALSQQPLTGGWQH